MASKQEYIEAIRQLPIENPTVDDPRVRILFPHLNADEIKAALQLTKEGRTNFTAIPPLRVDDSFQIVSFLPAYTSKSRVHRTDGNIMAETKNHLPSLHWAFARRTGIMYPHEYKAVEFARNNWKNDLVSDNWADFVTVQLYDPSQLGKAGYPTPMGAVHFTTNRPWNTIVSDYSKPRSELVEEAIVEMTTDTLISKELVGNRGVYEYAGCGYCGSELGLQGCGGCGYTFRDDQYKSGFGSPLPSKLVKLLTDEGFVFKKDPAIARETEKAYFERLHKGMLR